MRKSLPAYDRPQTTTGCNMGESVSPAVSVNGPIITVEKPRCSKQLVALIRYLSRKPVYSGDHSSSYKHGNARDNM